MSSTLRRAVALFAAAAVAIVAVVVASAGQADAASYRIFRPVAGVKVQQISPSKVRITNRTGHSIAVRTTVRQSGWSLTDTHYVCHNGTETDGLWGRGRVVRVRMYAHPGAGC